MNAMSPVLIADLQRSPLADAACTWRGRYVEEFAIAEVIVSEALATLSTFDGSGARSLLPRAVGQRFEALRAVVDAGGPLALVGCRVVKALDDLRDISAAEISCAMAPARLRPTTWVIGA